ncbi:MAG: hypothetical protein ABI411_08450 [Tahibacter sp.]
MKTRMLMTGMLAGLSLVGISPAIAQVPANGNFETGTIASWTAGGDARTGAIRATNITPTTSITIPEGIWAAAISTGPGQLAQGPIDFDGLGGANDYDQSWLQSTFTMPAGATSVAFDWGFASSEQNEPDQYDDLMDVTVNGTRIMTRSSCKLNGSSYSPFPNANCQNATVVDHTVNNTAIAALRTINLRFGSPAFQRICLPLPNGIATGSSVNLRFTVSDQNDRQVDSTLFIDNVQVKTSCNEVGSIVQLTNTGGGFVEVKGGGFAARVAGARNLASDATGKIVSFVTNGNISANPSLLDQIYTWDGTAFTRATGLTVQSGGTIQALAMASQNNGRYLAIAAKLVDTDNTEVYRYDRTTNTLTAITSTAGCDNTSPSISGDGGVIAYESTCNALTGSGTSKKIVVWNGTANSASLFGTAACTMAEPALTKNANGRYLAFKSTCVHNGTNADGNSEIYRFDRGATGTNSGTTTGNFVRITDTANTVQNTSPVLDGSATGLYVYFISSGNLTPTAPIFNSDLSLEIFRYQVGAGTPLTQRTNSSDSYYIGVDVQMDGAIDYAYERVSLLNGQFSVGRRQINGTAGAADPEDNLATGNSTNTVRIGRDSLVPVVNFISAENFLGTNADVNPEVWQGRVQ